MRTIIRLQNKYPANTKLYKIVIQGNKTHLSGRYIEHLGWWRPLKTKDYPRSIVLNKNRLRYWIGNGAMFHDRVQRFFNFADMMPAPWVKFGTKTIYKDEKEKVTRWKKGMDKFYENAFHKDDDELYEIKKEKEIEAMFFRRIKFRKGLMNYLDKEIQVEQIVNESRDLSKSDDILTRSEKFDSLKKIYDSIENEGIKMSDYKKQMIYTKMNELTEDGVVSEEDIRGEFVYKGEKYNFTELEKVFERKYVERKQKGKQNLQELIKMINTISEAEFTKVLEEKTQLDYAEIVKTVKKIYDDKAKNKLNVHYFDLVNFLNIHEGLFPNAEQKLDHESQRKQSERVLHSNNPTTPLPDLNEYDPKDWFDLREDTIFPIRPVTKENLEWFETPLTDAIEFNKHKVVKKKRNIGLKSALVKDLGKDFKFRPQAMYKGLADNWNNSDDDVY